MSTLTNVDVTERPPQLYLQEMVRDFWDTLYFLIFLTLKICLLFNLILEFYFEKTIFLLITHIKFTFIKFILLLKETNLETGQMNEGEVIGQSGWMNIELPKQTLLLKIVDYYLRDKCTLLQKVM